MCLSVSTSAHKSYFSQSRLKQTKKKLQRIYKRHIPISITWEIFGTSKSIEAKNIWKVLLTPFLPKVTSHHVHLIMRGDDDVRRTHDGLDPSWKTRKKRPAASSSFHRFVGFFIRRDGSPLLLGFPIMCRHHAARWHVLLGSCPWPITTSQACSPWPDMLTWTSGALGRDARKERERGLKGCERPVCVCVDILCVLPFSLPTTTFQTSPYVSCLATFLPVDSF